MDFADLPQKRELYCFNGFRFDVAERGLWFAGAPVTLKPKQFELLSYFVRNAGRVATKSELLDAVWADAFVEESTLARNVSWLRNTLGKYADGEIIETVAKLGYRFTPPVSVFERDEDTFIVEKQTLQYFRGTETITFDDEPRAKEEKQQSPSQNAALSPPRYSLRTISFSAALLVFVALAGIASFIYWNATPGESRAVAKTRIEKIAIDAARPTFDSGIDVRRGDLIAFSVDGGFNHRNGQIWTYEGDKNAVASNDFFYEKAAPWSLVAWIGTETDQSRYFQVSKINSITADRNGSLYFAVNKPRSDYTANSGTIVADVTLSRHAENERPQIKIGSTINLQNRYPNVGGYLDAWGSVWKKPEFAKITTEIMIVSTHYDPNRDNGSGSWEIVSATGKTSGEPLVVGDRIHLRNKFPGAGYLDSCGWVEHLPIYKDYKDQTTAVFTTESPNRDYGTGTWIVRSATESDGSPVLEGDSIGLENGFIVVVKGKVYKTGFLNVAGNVKDIPSFSDYDGASLVFTQNRSDGQPVLDIWTISLSKAF